jgi:hypothetical protein
MTAEAKRPAQAGRRAVVRKDVAVHVLPLSARLGTPLMFHGCYINTALQGIGMASMLQRSAPLLSQRGAGGGAPGR